MFMGDPATDQSNCMVFVGGIDDSYVTAEDLRAAFQHLGTVRW